MQTPTKTTRTHTSKGGFRRLLQTVLLTSLLITGGLTVLRLLGAFEQFEIAAYDSFMRFQGAESPDDRILIVGIDESDIQSRQEYPLEEGTVVDLLTALERHDPRVIALDFALDLPQGTPEGRAELTELLTNSDNIVSACYMSSEQFPGVPPAPGISEDLVGFADFPVDKDGVTRRSLMVSQPTGLPETTSAPPHVCNQPDADLPLFSLSMLLADMYLLEEDVAVDQTNVGDIIWDSTVVRGLTERSGGYASTGAVDYQVMLNYRAPRDAVLQVSLTEVLQDQVEPDWIRDRIILIGYTSPAVGDLLNTPYRETREGTRGMYGVMVHAQATSQLISAVLDGRPLMNSWPELGEILLIGLGSLLGGSLAFYLRRPSLFVIGIIFMLVGFWVGAYGLFIQGFWLPVVPLTVVSLLSAIAVGIVRQAQQSVYTQAVFEQFQAQLNARDRNVQISSRDRLYELVQRAQKIRTQRLLGDAIDNEAIDQATDDPLHLEFASPETQTFYEERIKAPMEAKLEAEKAKFDEAKAKFDTEKAKLQTHLQSTSGSQSQKHQSLLQKSRNTRLATRNHSAKGKPHA